MKILERLLRNNRGSAESALVLIPLLILFLIGMDIAGAAHLRNRAQIEVQNEASKRAISGDFLPSDSFIHIDSSGEGQDLDLLVAHHDAKLVNLIPGFLGEKSSRGEIYLNGIATIENGR